MRFQMNISMCACLTFSNPGSLKYGFSFIRDCIDRRTVDKLWAGLQDGPDHVLKQKELENVSNEKCAIKNYTLYINLLTKYIYMWHLHDTSNQGTFGLNIFIYFTVVVESQYYVVQ